MLDISYILLNAITSLIILSESTEPSRSVRIFEALTALVLWTKLLYFLQLFDEISPLIQIIIKIFDDIKFFMVTLTVGVFAFSNAFWLLGRN